MADQIVPGPCPATGCPAPVQIDCVEVTKVYDFCFLTESRDQMCFDIPTTCGPVPPGTTATGTVSSVTCTAQSITPILNASGAPTGFANVTLFVTATITFTLTAPAGGTICSFSGMLNLFKTVVLCAPTGVNVTCEAPASTVGPAVIVAGEVCSPLLLCLLIESVATVKLLIPTYGFCTPAPCVVAPAPPFACPPSPLFPAQCAPAVPTSAQEQVFPTEGPVV